MGDIAEYFDRSEFACKCGCGQDGVDPELLEILDKIREHFGLPMTINSGNRCILHNDAVGGVRFSQHLLGKAADCVIKGIEPQLVAEAAVRYGARGIKSYNTFTHIDTRTGNQWYG